MHIVDVEFRGLHEITVNECLGKLGAYVLWSDAAFARPSYIGEGYLLDRILRHTSDGTKPISRDEPLGYVCVLDGGSPKARKRDAEIVEATLLEAANILGMTPRHNRVAGKLGAVEEAGSWGDEVVRVNVRGWHPLRFATRIRGAARLTWRYYWDSQCYLLDEMPWRRT